MYICLQKNTEMDLEKLDVIFFLNSYGFLTTVNLLEIVTFRTKKIDRGHLIAWNLN